MKKKLLSIFLVLALIIGLTGCAGTKEQGDQQEGQKSLPENRDVILATTTSTQDSGLLDVLVPMFEEESGYLVKPIAVGTGQALAMGEKGEADAVLTHAPSSELPLVQARDLINYQLVMHNDFILVGHSQDPAGIKGLETTVEALKKVSETESIFASRGDDSGTHKKELTLWKKADIAPAGNWYQESGTGMGPTLKIASEKGGYTITDRATYLSLKDGLALDIMVEGEKELLNIYHVAQVNPEKSTMINGEGAKAFVEFMVREDVQKVIGDFGKDKYGQSLFFPDAGKDPKEFGLEY